MCGKSIGPWKDLRLFRTRGFRCLRPWLQAAEFLRAGVLMVVAHFPSRLSQRRVQSQGLSFECVLFPSEQAHVMCLARCVLQASRVWQTPWMRGIIKTPCPTVSSNASSHLGTRFWLTKPKTPHRGPVDSPSPDRNTHMLRPGNIQSTSNIGPLVRHAETDLRRSASR